MTSTKLGEITVNGKSISMFTPPHPQPDFLWVDAEELAAAFLNAEDAKRMTQHAQRYGDDVRAVVTVPNGDRIATVMCHAMAQGLCGAIDHWKGFKPKDDHDTGPAHNAYCLAAGRFMADNWPLSFEGMIHALRHPGGDFMKGGSK